MTTSAERLAAAVAAARRRPGPLRVDAPRLGIHSLDGIEAAHDLRVLRLDHNAISDLTQPARRRRLRGAAAVPGAARSPRQRADRRTGAPWHPPACGGSVRQRVADVSPISTLERLAALDLSENPLTSITPLAGLTGLRSLYLWSTGIDDVSALAALTGLREPGLADDHVADVTPLVALRQLEVLYLGGNDAIPNHQVERLRDASIADFRAPDWKDEAPGA